MIYKFYNNEGFIVVEWYVPPTPAVFARYGDNYIYFEERPVIEQKEGYAAVERVNVETKEWYVTYEKLPDPEPSPEERIAELETSEQSLNDQVTSLQLALVELYEAQGV